MIHADSSLRYLGRLFVPSSCQDAILREFHHSPLAVHPGGTKMYRDLRRQFWWPGMKKDVALFVSRCLTCQQVKAEHQRPAGLDLFLALVYNKFCVFALIHVRFFRFAPTVAYCGVEMRPCDDGFCFRLCYDFQWTGCYLGYR